MTFWLQTLISPRPTFQSDMTDEERGVMHEHVRYWRGHVESGKVLAFGPLIHSRAEFGGVALVVLEDDEGPTEYGLSDPAIRAEVGFRFEVFSMPQLVTKSH